MSSFRTLSCALALHSVTMNKTRQEISRFIIRVEIPKGYKGFTNIQNFVSIYNGQQGGYKLDDIKNHSIKVPYNNQKIDYEFMNDIISILEHEYILKIERYLRENELEVEIKLNEKDALRNLENTFFKV